MSADLIARLEAATGPDRELDCLIHVEALIPKERIGRIDIAHGYVGWHPVDAPYQSAVEPLRYTASIDAALTLVPPAEQWPDGDMSFDLGCEYGWWTVDFTCFARAGEDNGPGSKFYVRAKTAPLALCIAALKARLPLETEVT